MTEPLAPLRIVEFRAENFKRLKVVEIRPDSDVVEIRGRNRQGKTSVLDAILAAIGGTREIQMKPIRTGCERASIKLDLGELTIERRFKIDAESPKGYTTDLAVRRADGSKMDKQQDVLNVLMGDFTFDPLAFTRLSSAEQFDVLKAFVPGVDFAADAKADREDFSKRTDVNRAAKALRAQAEAITLPPGALPKEVDLQALEDKLAKAADHNSDIERRKGARTAAEDRLAAIAEEIVRLTGEMDTIKAKLQAADPLPDPIDTAQVQADLATGRAGNSVRAAAARRKLLETQAQNEEDEAARLTKAMDDRETARTKAIASAKMPVPGLGFAGETITLNGEPFEQGSDEEQLTAALAIAVAQNPRLRVARIRDGNKLDDVAMKVLHRFAAEKDLQVWIEIVDSTGEAGFVLEDGYLKGEGPEEVEDTV